MRFLVVSYLHPKAPKFEPTKQLPPLTIIYTSWTHLQASFSSLSTSKSEYQVKNTHQRKPPSPNQIIMINSHSSDEFTSQSRSNPTLLGRLRTAVNKVRFLLRNLTPPSATWRLISVLRSSTALLHARRGQQPPCLSFNDRRPSGLIDACDYLADQSECYESFDQARSSANSSPAASSPGRVLHRTASSPESTGSGSGGEEPGDAEIDRKAEMFIANFYRQLRLEKQVSLELRYCRGYSFGSSSQPSPESNLSLTSPT